MLLPPPISSSSKLDSKNFNSPLYTGRQVVLYKIKTGPLTIPTNQRQLDEENVSILSTTN